MKITSGLKKRKEDYLQKLEITNVDIIEYFKYILNRLSNMFMGYN